MGMAQWQVDLQTGSALAVGAVVGSDLSAMHLYDGPAEVQSDARSLDVQVVGVFALVETLEQPVGLLVLESDAAVYDLYGPPSKVYLKAFDNRLEMTLSNWMRSIQAFTGRGSPLWLSVGGTNAKRISRCWALY